MGIDPGLGGALAIWDNDRSLTIFDMPVWWMEIGAKRKKRRRVDAVALASIFDFAYAAGVELVVMESLGGRPAGMGSANTAYMLGFTVGLTYMAAIQSRIPVETTHPSVWKRLMRVPKDDDGILHRFDEIFPEHRAQVRGVRGGARHDRAEAAMLAKFGADRLADNVRPNVEWRLAYQGNDVGA